MIQVQVRQSEILNLVSTVTKLVGPPINRMPGTGRGLHLCVTLTTLKQKILYTNREKGKDVLHCQ